MIKVIKNITINTIKSNLTKQIICKVIQKKNKEAWRLFDIGDIFLCMKEIRCLNVNNLGNPKKHAKIKF